MTFEEALEFKKSNMNLIGNVIEGQKVSYIFIVPSNGQKLGEIVGAIVEDRPYAQYYVGSKDFEVNVLFDINKYYTTGNIFHQRLKKILDKRSK